VAAPLGVPGITGWERFSAWMPDFSSTHSTTAFSGRLRWRPRTSTTFSRYRRGGAGHHPPPCQGRPTSDVRGCGCGRPGRRSARLTMRRSLRVPRSRTRRVLRKRGSASSARRWNASTLSRRTRTRPAVARMPVRCTAPTARPEQAFVSPQDRWLNRSGRIQQPLNDHQISPAARDDRQAPAPARSPAQRDTRQMRTVVVSPCGA
jgi:hypothetical protein